MGSKWVVSVVGCASIALIACSSAPVERTGSTGEAVTAGQYTLAPGHIIHIPPPVCDVVYARLECPEYVFAEAWAVQTADGACAPIATTHGTWAQIFSQSPPPGYDETFNGVPGLGTHWFPPPSPSCSSVLTGSCCTYVWWPNGWPDDPDPAVADPSALCTWDTQQMVPIPLYECPIRIDNGVCGCGSPGGGGCDTCVQWGAPIGP
jgi:hypothetical protein